MELSEQPRGRLQGKVAVVTGAARGVGFATAQRFCQEGATVLMTDINSEQGEAAAAQIGARFMLLDVAQEADWQRCAALIVEDYGKLDILVNNAAILRASDILQESLQQWRQVMAVNADSVFMAIHHLLPIITTSGAGSIINMSSSSALLGMPHFCAYTAAKAAVRNLTMSTAVLCKQQGGGVRCNSVHPDGINTTMAREIAADMPADVIAGYQRTAPFICQPDDVANTLLFLASDESRHINGAAICLDNTATIHPPYL